MSLIAFRRTAGSRYGDQPECFIPSRSWSWSPGQDATLPHGSWPTLTASSSPEPVLGDQLIEEYARRPQAIPPAGHTPEGLTDRELEVFALVARGLSNAEIA